MTVSRITRTREVAPDPSIAKAVGRHHTFETAIADLVDNSLDAGASNILVRFLEKEGVINGLQVIDDGKGMDSAQIDSAMEFARKRDYETSDQGHFGLGLKAASLSQADHLYVYSVRYGAVPAGRTITAATPTLIGEIDAEDTNAVLDEVKVDFARPSGTVVEWVHPRKFLSSTDSNDRARWLGDQINSLRTHLGLTFHRHLSARRVTIAIDVFDTKLREAGPRRLVATIDPFGYTALPNDSFPARLTFAVDGVQSAGTAHLWPPSQVGLPEFRLYGKPGSLSQGFYFYRNDRLLQAGGWNTLTVDRAETELVRVSIDIDESITKHITINPEKAGLELDSDLRLALLGATLEPSGNPLRSLLDSAEDRRRESRRYVKRAVKLVRPGRGFSPDVREAFEESVEPADVPEVSIRWQVDGSESPVRIDLENRAIWLNSAYRELIAGGNALDNEDAPFFKTLLLMHFSKYFEGTFLGSRAKAELDTWNQLLTAAIREESARQEEKMRLDDE